MAEKGTPHVADESADNTLSYAQLYADLVAAAKETVPDYAFSFQKFVDDTGMEESTARRFLDSKVRAGILEKRYATVEGHQRAYYWFKDGRGAQLGGNSDAVE